MKGGSVPLLPTPLQADPLDLVMISKKLCLAMKTHGLNTPTPLENAKP